MNSRTSAIFLNLAFNHATLLKFKGKAEFMERDQYTKLHSWNTVFLTRIRINIRNLTLFIISLLPQRKVQRDLSAHIPSRLIMTYC